MMTTQQRAAYDHFLKQLYDATEGILLAGSLATGDTKPAAAKTWEQLDPLERRHFNTHVIPFLRGLAGAFYCVNGLDPKDVT
jgi:hypothetical protein